MVKGLRGLLGSGVMRQIGSRKAWSAYNWGYGTGEDKAQLQAWKQYLGAQQVTPL